MSRRTPCRIGRSRSFRASRCTGKLNVLFGRKASDAAMVVIYAHSHLEKRIPAITLRCPSCGHPDALDSHGEIVHVHPSDGSMHMILSAQDANSLIRAGWAERHGLAGVTLGLPSAYMLVNAPRDDAELAMVDRVIDASIAHMADYAERMVRSSRCSRPAPSSSTWMMARIRAGSSHRSL